MKAKEEPLEVADKLLTKAQKLVDNYYGYVPEDNTEAVARVTSLGVLANSIVNHAWTTAMLDAIKEPDPKVSPDTAWVSSQELANIRNDDQLHG